MGKVITTHFLLAHIVLPRFHAGEVCSALICFGLIVAAALVFAGSSK